MTRQPILAYEMDELRDVLQIMRLAGGARTLRSVG